MPIENLAAYCSICHGTPFLHFKRDLEMRKLKSARITQQSVGCQRVLRAEKWNLIHANDVPSFLIFLFHFHSIDFCVRGSLLCINFKLTKSINNNNNDDDNSNHIGLIFWILCLSHGYGGDGVTIKRLLLLLPSESSSKPKLVVIGRLAAF